MFPFNYGSIGMKGSLMLGFTVADILTRYWNSKDKPPKIYFFGRRIHHGEIGALLTLSLLFGRRFSLPATGILTGLGGGLLKDDFADIKEWFRFTERQRSNSLSKKGVNN
jgi:hypothetical protein